MKLRCEPIAATSSRLADCDSSPSSSLNETMLKLVQPSSQCDCRKRTEKSVDESGFADVGKAYHSRSDGPGLNAASPPALIHYLAGFQRLLL